MESIEAAFINDEIKNIAKNPDGEPMFRLVWSTDQLEFRKGTVIHYVNNIRIGEAEQLGHFPKYSWMPNRWVLEQWYPGSVTYTPEIPGSEKGSYEPIYPFEDGKGQPLPLNLQVVKFIISKVFQPKSSNQLIKSTIADDMNLTDEEADKYIMSALNDESHLVSLIHSGEGAIMPASPVLPDAVNIRNKK